MKTGKAITAVCATMMVSLCVYGGENLLKNGSFAELDASGEPVGWGGYDKPVERNYRKGVVFRCARRGICAAACREARHIRLPRQGMDRQAGKLWSGQWEEKGLANGW